jgi:F0F1-type ATP synthase epsilon subunit
VSKKDQKELKQTDDEHNDEIKVRVLSQFQTLYDDWATSFSAKNDTGPFDILKGHANFLTLISPCTATIQRADDIHREVDIERGVVRATHDVVEVFLDV